MTPSQEFKKAKHPGTHTDSTLAKLLAPLSDKALSVLSDPERKVQIIYTRIDRNKANKPVFTHFYYGVNPQQYFYPASTVKLPVAVLALQRLNELNVEGLDKNATMITEAGFDGQTPVFNDPGSPDGRPTIANYIKKIFLASDNDAFNRLYEFLGQEYINHQLHQLGYDSTQIIHRLDVVLSEEQNRATNPVRFYDTASRVIYDQPLVISKLAYHPRHTLLGKGYLQNGTLVEQPFDFSKKNRLTLPDLHSILMSIIFPEAVNKKQRFNLTPEDYRFLHRYMSMLPRESDVPQYDSSYADAYVKFLFYGGSGRIEDTSMRIFNKVGDAYGFLTDAAYIVDFEKGVEFLLSATVYCNSDGIFNDDKYDYKTVGFPFLESVGRTIYEYEVQRKRKHKPELSDFHFSYKSE